MIDSRVYRILPLLVLIAIGLGCAWIASAYRVGTLTAMGAGFLPLALGLVLALLAVVLLLLPRPAAAPETTMPSLRTIACVLAGIFAWTLLVERAGFIPAALVQLLLSALALPGLQWRMALIGSIAMAAAAWLLFVGMLGLPVPAFGG